MATPNANQRENRVSTPKIPAVIAKPAAPTQTLNVYGSPATNARPVTKTVAKKTSDSTKTVKSPYNTTGPFNEFGGVGTDVYGPSSTVTTNTDTTVVNTTVVEDASLAYAKMQDEKARQDAFALLKDLFASYGLAELATEIEGYMREGLGTSQATLKLKQSAAYKERFYGNELRRNAGLNVIDEASYLDLENSYSETLKAYGLQDYFGIGVTPTERKNRQKAIADVIGKDISAVEFKERVSTAVDRVKMADKATKDAFQTFYGIGEADLAKYFLDPSKSLVTLKEKATAAEIGGAAIGMGLAATATSAEDLAKFGINREQAQVGYSTIASELPTAQKLGQIYSGEGIDYNQAEAEAAT
ncbi:hypothetical protein EB001_19470, partial [bacterium]|nr:hypothetical protein [bacterium]